jgi:hypothetical protein
VLALVRGDANRIVGHEAEALRDYATAVAAIDLERRSDDRPAEADEAAPARHSRRRAPAPKPEMPDAELPDAESPDAVPPNPDAQPPDSESPDPKENS